MSKDKRRPLSKTELAQFESEAFNHMIFDPGKLAPVLDNKPTLLLLGTFDTIVPAENGTLLYQKLEKPELWKYPVGHQLLMLSLPSHAEQIKLWLRTHCPADFVPKLIPFEKRKRIRVRIEDNTAEK